MTRRAVVATVVASSLALVWGCSTTEVRLGIQPPAPPPSFVAAEAGADLDGAVDPLIAYCPSNQCPSGWNTCPNSRFACDVNLLTDMNNCGECGHACPEGTAAVSFSCVGGTCRPVCGKSYLDCDGLPDNGCETLATDNDNCGSCGTRCTDPDKPCMWQDPPYYTVAACGCPAGLELCNGTCVNLKNDSNNCGACGNACDPTGGGTEPLPPEMQYQCAGGTCALLCKSHRGDCDGLSSNGCETKTHTNENCSKCGDACATGQECRTNLDGLAQCMCPPGLTYCDIDCDLFGCRGDCVDIRSDAKHCGGCGLTCGGGVCNYGSCGEAPCFEGGANCNDSWEDGCETNINSDPRNCGGCGISCDLTIGQACVAGQCVVEPCDTGDAGELTR